MKIDTVRFWLKVRKEPDGCWFWVASVNKDGYGQFWNAGSMHKAHRVSYFLEHGVEAGDQLVLHTCDNAACVNPAHLYLGDDAQNMRDRDARGRGRQPKGEDAGPAKLNEEQVRSIRFALSIGVSAKRLAGQHKMSVSAIEKIGNRSTWKHLD